MRARAATASRHVPSAVAEMRRVERLAVEAFARALLDDQRKGKRS
jgi:hypothetical protein